jgi:hypothetical protein
LRKTHKKDCKILGRFELGIGPGRAENAVKCNWTVARYGLKLQTEIPFTSSENQAMNECKKKMP